MDRSSSTLQARLNGKPRVPSGWSSPCACPDPEFVTLLPAGGGDASDNAGVVLTGVQCLHVDELLPLKAVELPMRFLPLEAGVQAVGSGMVVTDELEGKVYDTVQAPNIYVCR